MISIGAVPRRGIALGQVDTGIGPRLASVSMDRSEGNGTIVRKAFDVTFSKAHFGKNLGGMLGE
jgi:hypothetical protein